MLQQTCYSKVVHSFLAHFKYRWTKSWNQYQPVNDVTMQKHLTTKRCTDWAREHLRQAFPMSTKVSQGVVEMKGRRVSDLPAPIMKQIECLYTLWSVWLKTTLICTWIDHKKWAQFIFSYLGVLFYDRSPTERKPDGQF